MYEVGFNTVLNIVITMLVDFVKCLSVSVGRSVRKGAWVLGVN